MKSYINILFLSSLLFISSFYSCYNDDNESDTSDSICNVEKPVEDLDWLISEIETADALYDFVVQSKFDGKTIFILGNCNPLINAVIPVKDCSGSTVGVLGDEANSIPFSTMDSGDIIWRDANFQCELNTKKGCGENTGCAPSSSITFPFKFQLLNSNNNVISLSKTLLENIVFQGDDLKNNLVLESNNNIITVSLIGVDITEDPQVLTYSIFSDFGYQKLAFTIASTWKDTCKFCKNYYISKIELNDEITLFDDVLTHQIIPIQLAPLQSSIGINGKYAYRYENCVTEPLFETNCIEWINFHDDSTASILHGGDIVYIVSYEIDNSIITLKDDQNKTLFRIAPSNPS